jgi:hypothetical protein
MISFLGLRLAAARVRVENRPTADEIIAQEIRRLAARGELEPWTEEGDRLFRARGARAEPLS